MELVDIELGSAYIPFCTKFIKIVSFYSYEIGSLKINIFIIEIIFKKNKLSLYFLNNYDSSTSISFIPEIKFNISL